MGLSLFSWQIRPYGLDPDNVKPGMTVILILVVFNFSEGSEPVTAEFDTIAACETAALVLFEDVDPSPKVLPFELRAGPDVIENMMIVEGANGTDIGM